MQEHTPKEIVTILDRYIIGQDAAKRAVAIALRNRWRRTRLDEKLRREVVPKNILMIGPTGVGKTEIARRLARLASAPFIKVEATRFTEVGYVGRDVEQIIRDLVETAVHMAREEKHQALQDQAHAQAEERVIDALVGLKASDDTRAKFLQKLRSGVLDDKEIEIEVIDTKTNMMPTFDIPDMPGAQVGMLNLGDMFGKALGQQKKTRRIAVKDSYDVLIAEESDKLLDEDELIAEAIHNVENNGIVFIDEIDKVTSGSEKSGTDVSREGVQRDLLPLIEGTNVTTKRGVVKTDHILFIASGAFHLSKPSDILPELQGRLPVRVELKPLSEKDFVRILTEPEASLITQYKALLGVDELSVDFNDEAICEIAAIATEINQNVENIGARRLHTVMERLLEELSYEASDMQGMKITIDAAYVRDKVSTLARNADLSRFIL